MFDGRKVWKTGGGWSRLHVFAICHVRDEAHYARSVWTSWRMAARGTRAHLIPAGTSVFLWAKCVHCASVSTIHTLMLLYCILQPCILCHITILLSFVLRTRNREFHIFHAALLGLWSNIYKRRCGSLTRIGSQRWTQHRNNNFLIRTSGRLWCFFCCCWVYYPSREPTVSPRHCAGCWCCFESCLIL